MVPAEYNISPSGEASSTYVISPNGSWRFASKYVITIASTNANGITTRYKYDFVTATQPAVIGHSPAADATMALTNGTITVVFNKPMDTDPSHFAANTNLKLIKEGNEVPLASGLVWSDNGMVVTASPSARLDYNAVYTVKVIGARDADTNKQNFINDYTWEFTTSDTSYINRITLKYDGVAYSNPFDAPINSTIDVGFTAAHGLNDEQKASITAAISGRIIGGLSIASFTPATSWDGNVLTITPTLVNNAKYTLILSNMMDDNGYVLPDKVIYEFQTTAKPYIVAVFPTKGTTTMKPTDSIVLSFSKPIKDTSIAGFALTRTPANGAALSTYYKEDFDYTKILSTDRKYLTFTPGTNIHGVSGLWDYNTKYTLDLTIDSIEDDYGNKLNTSEFNSSSFTTTFCRDIASFTFVAPDIDPLNVPIGTTKTNGIKLTFTEILGNAQKTDSTVVGGLTFKYTNEAHPSPTTVEFANSYSWDIDPNASGSTLIIKTNHDLEYGATEYLTFNKITDANGLAAPNKQFKFYTAVQPTIVSISPASGSTVLSANQIAVTFSKPMNIATLNNGVNVTLTGGSLTSPGLAHFDLINSGYTLIASPTGLLEHGETYTLEVKQACRDTMDIMLPNTIKFNFSIHERSGLVSVFPVENAINVASCTDIIATFTSNIAYSGGVDKPTCSVFIESVDYTSYYAEPVWADNKLTLTNTTALPNNSLVTVTIGNIKDVDGYLIDYGFEEKGTYVYSFTTDVMPTVVHVMPVKDDTPTVASITQPIIIVFDKPMLASTLTYDNIEITETNYNQQGSGRALDSDDFIFSYEETALNTGKYYALTITPSSEGGDFDNNAFAYRSTYQVDIKPADITDINGNKLDGGVTYSFITEDPTEPAFKNFTLSRDRLKITASYSVNNHNCPDILEYGFKINNSIDMTCASDVTYFNKGALLATSTISTINDMAYVSFTMTGFTEGDEYTIKPFVKVKYGVVDSHCLGDEGRFRVYPWNLRNNGTSPNINSTNSDENKFIVATREDLKAIATKIATYKAGFFIQTEEISLKSDESFAFTQSIGTSGSKFTGTYVGSKISDLPIPLFGYTQNAIITNITAVDVNLTTSGAILVNNSDGATSITNNTIVSYDDGGDRTKITGCISNSGTLEGNSCLIHDHKSLETAAGALTEATHQKYLINWTNQPIVVARKTLTIVGNGQAELTTGTVTNVGSSTQILFTYNKPMNEIVCSKAFTLRDSSSNLVACDYIWEKQTDDSCSQLTIAPKSTLDAGITYTLTVNTASIEDIFGKTLGSSPLTYRFAISNVVEVTRVVIYNSNTNIIADSSVTTPYDNDKANIPVDANINFVLSGQTTPNFDIIRYDLNNNPSRCRPS